ncbi:MAG TPA: Asp-tRNA(Asn)/Glu-tRNA(Gln) amidotransferase subunit GatB [Myxococcota bacterium]
MSAHPDYEVVIGLEVHAQLRTESKLFSPAPVRYGAPPNHSVHPICLALPGVLPVLNERAVELAVRAALATHCTVHERSIFARKNYFYPDLPKGYQISQYEEPLATQGWLDVAVGPDAEEELTRVRLTRIHMEEDAGKSIHDAAVVGSGVTHVDLNRAGVPLIEIVSEPDIRSPEQAVAYLRTLRSVLRYIDVSDADMERGNFRCDANISLRPRGRQELGVRTELKNLNSFRFIQAALEAEIARQAELLDEGGEVKQATLAFDPATGRIRVLRLKENADDYRYFPDPDLVPLILARERIEAVRRSLPELAEAKCERFQREYALSAHEARALTETRGLSEFFEAAAREHAAPRSIANWVLRDVLRALNERGVEIEQTRLEPAALAALVRLVDEGRTTTQSARGLVPELVERGGDPAALVGERGLEAVSDAGSLEPAVDAVLGAHPDDVARYRSGEKKVLNFLMGQVMRHTQGKADPAAVRRILVARMEAEEDG